MVKNIVLPVSVVTTTSPTIKVVSVLVTFLRYRLLFDYAAQGVLRHKIVLLRRI